MKENHVNWIYWKCQVILMALVCVSMVIAGCAATKQARKTETSGFLGDYSQLKEGGKGEALLVYIAPDVQWRKYKKIQMEPITVWSNDQLEDVPKEELQAIVDNADSAVREALKSDYEFTDRPGPDVLRIRAAITQAEGSGVVLDTISTIIPQIRTLSTIKTLATGTAAFVGEAGVEAEILDPLTNTRLGAAVDRRV